MKLNDLTGKQFGRWTVLGRELGRKLVYWECRCECGRTGLVSSNSLLRSHSKSCGCFRDELVSKRRRDPLGPANRIYRCYVRNAQKVSREFALTLDEFEKIVTSPCYYCGDLPHGWVTEKNRRTPPFGGVDRIDSLKGYVMGNVLPACGTCNQMKHLFSIEEFSKQIRKIYLNWADKNA